MGFQIKNDLFQQFLNLQSFVKSLLNLEIQRDSILQWFQKLCSNLTTIIYQISELCKTDKNKHALKTTILLYLTQIISSISLLINILVTEEEQQIILKEPRKCLIKQISYCLELLEVALKNGQVVDDPSGNFIKWMDTALEKITEMTFSLSKFKEIREIFEEVLSHAMSIAQVSLLEDSKAIRGASQFVLLNLNLLEHELEAPEVNKSVVKLNVNSCSDKLCSLEKKVNTAVLRLCLNTFSKYTQPLERIQQFCQDKNNKTKVEELDGLVADFDLHVDRIMQIGLFAVSCSSDLSCGIKIRSCLASLESLESELVPSLNSLLFNPTRETSLNAEILIKHWSQQALALRDLIFLIIDPFAFCQVIYEEAFDFIESFSKKTLTRKDVYTFLQVAKVLQIFLDKAQSEFELKLMEKIGKDFKDYKEVLEEVEKSSAKLLSHGNSDFESSRRVFKRCKILVTVLKRLWVCFADDDLPEIQKESSEVIEATGNKFLDHIINRGKQILQDRSVLYKTPKTESKLKCKEVPLSRLVHLRKLSFLNFDANKNETSLDLQISDILNEMSQLSTKIKTN